MLNRDRYLVLHERDYDGEAIEYFPLNEFPYPAELEEVTPINLKLNTLKTTAGKCFHNAFRAAMKHDSYNVVFCYYGLNDESLTPHAIVEQSGIYFDFISNDEIDRTKYYRYATIDYHNYLALMRE